MSNEIALYGLSADGGVTIQSGTWHESTPDNAAQQNQIRRAQGSGYEYVRISSLPAALNAERNEKVVEVLTIRAEAAEEALSDAYHTIRELVRLRAPDFEEKMPNETRPTIRAALNPKEGE